MSKFRACENKKAGAVEAHRPSSAYEMDAAFDEVLHHGLVESIVLAGFRKN